MIIEAVIPTRTKLYAQDVVLAKGGNFRSKNGMSCIVQLHEWVNLTSDPFIPTGDLRNRHLTGKTTAFYYRRPKYIINYPINLYPMTTDTNKNRAMTTLSIYCYYNFSDNISCCNRLNPGRCNIIFCIDKPQLNNEATFLLRSSGAVKGVGTFRQKLGSRKTGNGSIPLNPKNILLRRLSFHLKFN